MILGIVVFENPPRVRLRPRKVCVVFRVGVLSMTEEGSGVKVCSFSLSIMSYFFSS